ncbi:hypothetical protein AMS68_007971 [Peltaster fructicola]|uniref:Uncharacterized protein n=1 Tax=Peltaster fructicola TaxID=286661 RepID=A0A6H0Y603_9PEZI|nr:hypothetical protein AMS68_007971 [Peltaster fructicola]
MQISRGGTADGYLIAVKPTRSTSPHEPQQTVPQQSPDVLASNVEGINFCPKHEAVAFSGELQADNILNVRPSDDEQHMHQATRMQVLDNRHGFEDVSIGSKEALLSTSSTIAPDTPHKAEATISPSSALLDLPRELRDMIYAELAVHYADPDSLKALPIPHGYQYKGPARIESLHTIRGSRPPDVPDTRIYLTLQLVCRQVKIEIEEFRAGMKHMDAELEIICKAPQIFVPLWTRLPLLRVGDQLININVTVRLRTYDPIHHGDFLLDFIHALIEHQPTSCKWEPWASSIMERVRARVGLLRITTVCEDMYTPDQYLDRVIQFQGRALTTQKSSFLEEIGEVVDIDGLRISTDTELFARRRYWYKKREGSDALASRWYNSEVSTERQAWDIYD